MNSVPGGTLEAVASGVAHGIASEANTIAKKVVEANTHLKDGVGQGKSWLLKKHKSLKNWWNQLPIIKDIIKWWKRHSHSHNHVDRTRSCVHRLPLSTAKRFWRGRPRL